MPAPTRRNNTASATTTRRKSTISNRKRAKVTPDFEPDYKDTAKLRRFLNDRNRIVPQAKSRTSAKFQREVARAIKRARTMALIP